MTGDVEADAPFLDRAGFESQVDDGSLPESHGEFQVSDLKGTGEYMSVSGVLFGSWGSVSRNTRRMPARAWVVFQLWGVACLATLCGCTSGGQDLGGANDNVPDPGGDGASDDINADEPVESSVDGRGLVTELSREGQRLTVDWSPDATSAQVAFDDNGQVTEFTIEVSFSDEALSEALDFLEGELDQDLSDLRQWIADHPGVVAESIAREANTARQENANEKISTSLQVTLPSVEDHLDRLRADVAKLAEVVYLLGLTFYQATSEPEDVRSEYEQAYRLAQDRWRQAREEQQLQERECAICSFVCEADCTTPNEGSCCRYAPGQSQCLPSDAKACSDDGGYFYESLSCADVACPEPGACCTNIDCLDSNETMCDLIGGKFFAETNCLEVDCGEGACYTLYETSLGDACCDCRIATDSECRDLSNFHFFVRNEECPGACYAGDGEDAYCYEDSESECLNNGGTAFFHESICTGICLYETGCTQANTRECDEFGGYMYYNVDSCFGACDYYDLNAAEGRCVRTGGPAECNALGGSFWLGETCP